MCEPYGKKGKKQLKKFGWNYTGNCRGRGRYWGGEREGERKGEGERKSNGAYYFSSSRSPEEEWSRKDAVYEGKRGGGELGGKL